MPEETQKQNQQPEKTTPQADHTENPISNIEPNVAGALAYILGPVTGVLFFVMEKENKFVRFHAVQSILLSIVLYVMWTIAAALSVVIIGLLIMPIISVGGLVLWLFLMWKAYNNEEYELPYLGKIAHDVVNKK